MIPGSVGRGARIRGEQTEFEHRRTGNHDRVIQGKRRWRGRSILQDAKQDLERQLVGGSRDPDIRAGAELAPVVFKFDVLDIQLWRRLDSRGGKACKQRNGSGQKDG